MLGTEYTEQVMSSKHVLTSAGKGGPAGEMLALVPLEVGSPISSQAK